MQSKYFLIFQLINILFVFLSPVWRLGDVTGSLEAISEVDERRERRNGVEESNRYISNSDDSGCL